MTSTRTSPQRSELGPYLAIFRRRLWMILLLFAVTMTVILVQAFTARPTYQAAVRLQVIAMETGQVGLYSDIPIDYNIDLTAYVFNQLVRSGRTAWQTIGELSLGVDAETLLRRIGATQDNEFVTVTAEADTPQAAEAIVTAHVENALQLYRDDRALPVVVTGEFITEQREEAEKTVAARQEALQQFKVTHGFDSLDREIGAYQDIARGLRRDQEGARLTIAQLKARIAALEAEADAAERTAREAAQDSTAQVEAQRRAAALLGDIAVLRGELAGQEALLPEYDASIARWETELTSLIGLVGEYEELSATLGQAQDALDFLYDKELEAQLKQKQAQRVGYLQVIEPARQPDSPVPSRTLQIAVIGGLLSLVAGAVLAVVAEAVGNKLGGSR